MTPHRVGLDCLAAPWGGGSMLGRSVKHLAAGIGLLNTVYDLRKSSTCKD